MKSSDHLSADQVIGKLFRLRSHTLVCSDSGDPWEYLISGEFITVLKIVKFGRNLLRVYVLKSGLRQVYFTRTRDYNMLETFEHV